MIQRVGRRVITLDAGRLASDQELPGTDPPSLEPPTPERNAEPGAELPPEPESGYGLEPPPDFDLPDFEEPR
jgi:hypothetical protein